jgi:hypothetical protein
MLRTAAILTTAATVLWHAVVGCSFCHAQAIDSTRIPAQVRPDAKKSETKKCADSRRCCCRLTIPAAATKPTVDDHAGKRGAANDEPPAEHVPFTPCDGKKCSFAVRKIVTANELDVTPLGFGYSKIGVAVSSVESSACACAHEADLKPPPLRRHLALGVLLI